MIKRVSIFAYGVFCYVVFFATFLYAIAFLGNFWVPRSIDAPVGDNLLRSIAIDLLLLSVFAIQHSVMARPWFKRWWTQYVPEPAERSTYVLLSSVALIALFALWQPLGGNLWAFDGTAAIAVYVVYALGWLLLLASTFFIDHFDLFGLRQVWLQLVDRPYRHLAFKTPGPYRLVRHPIYVGWLLIFWATPTMGTAHFLFAVMTTAYILVAIRFEEKDLVDHLGDDYRHYRQSTPALIPFSGGDKRRGATGAYGSVVNSTNNPKSGSYPAAVSWADGSQGGSGRVILATTYSRNVFHRSVKGNCSAISLT
ncbi:MAG: methanethiol S-methyltransferase [Burkholderiales bacterium]